MTHVTTFQVQDGQYDLLFYSSVLKKCDTRITQEGITENLRLFWQPIK